MRPQQLCPAVEDWDRDYQTRVAHDIVQEAKYAGEVAAFRNRAWLLLDEQTQAICQLRLLDFLIMLLRSATPLTSDSFLQSVYF